MALPSAELVKAAVETLYAAFAEDKTNATSVSGVQALNELRNKLDPMYPVVDSTITADSDDAGVSEWVTANAEVFVGAVLRMTVVLLFLLVSTPLLAAYSAYPSVFHAGIFR